MMMSMKAPKNKNRFGDLDFDEEFHFKELENEVEDDEVKIPPLLPAPCPQTSPTNSQPHDTSLSTRPWRTCSPRTLRLCLKKVRGRRAQGAVQHFDHPEPGRQRNCTSRISRSPTTHDSRLTTHDTRQTILPMHSAPFPLKQQVIQHGESATFCALLLDGQIAAEVPGPEGKKVRYPLPVGSWLGEMAYFEQGMA